MKLYGIIFDVDGVIADSESVNVRATALAFEELFGLSGVRARDFEAGIGRGAEEYVRAGARAHGRQLTAQEVAAGVKARQDTFLRLLQADDLPAFPGVLGLIGAALEDDSFCAAIATSSTREKSGAVLSSARVPVERMVYVCGDDITRKKPDPEVFLLACRRLGLPPASCVVIEDAPNGVQAAHRAGCTCVAVTNTCPREALAAADLTVDSLEEVSLEIVARLLG